MDEFRVRGEPSDSLLSLLCSSPNLLPLVLPLLPASLHPGLLLSLSRRPDLPAAVPASLVGTPATRTALFKALKAMPVPPPRSLDGLLSAALSAVKTGSKLWCELVRRALQLGTASDHNLLEAVEPGIDGWQVLAAAKALRGTAGIDLEIDGNDDNDEVDKVTKEVVRVGGVMSAREGEVWGKRLFRASIGVGEVDGDALLPLCSVVTPVMALAVLQARLSRSVPFSVVLDAVSHAVAPAAEEARTPRSPGEIRDAPAPASLSPTLTGYLNDALLALSEWVNLEGEGLVEEVMGRVRDNPENTHVLQVMARSGPALAAAADKVMAFCEAAIVGCGWEVQLPAMLVLASFPDRALRQASPAWLAEPLAELVAGTASPAPPKDLRRHAAALLGRLEPSLSLASITGHLRSAWGDRGLSPDVDALAGLMLAATHLLCDPTQGLRHHPDCPVTLPTSALTSPAFSALISAVKVQAPFIIQLAEVDTQKIREVQAAARGMREFCALAAVFCVTSAQTGTPLNDLAHHTQAIPQIGQRVRELLAASKT